MSNVHNIRPSNHEWLSGLSPEQQEAVLSWVVRSQGEIAGNLAHMRKQIESGAIYWKQLIDIQKACAAKIEALVMPEDLKSLVMALGQDLAEIAAFTIALEETDEVDSEDIRYRPSAAAYTEQLLKQIGYDKETREYSVIELGALCKDFGDMAQDNPLYIRTVEVYDTVHAFARQGQSAQISVIE